MPAHERDIERWWADEERRREGHAERCRRKRWFATEGEARAVALMDATQYRQRLAPYRCELCDGWHLTSGG
jgi:hypothetical protein